MAKGYVKLWRKTMDSGLLKNHKLWAFFSYCLLRANYRQHTEFINGSVVEIGPGEFIIGRKKAALELGLSEQSVRTCIKNLKELGIITNRPTNKYTIIKILNWSVYQGDEDKATSNQPSDQPTEQPIPNQQSTSNQPAVNHRQEGKKGRKKEEEEREGENSSGEEFSCLCSEVLLLWKKHCPNLPQIRKWTQQRQKKLIARIREDPERKNPDFWKQLFKRVSDSVFLTGLNNRGFIADLDWILKNEETILKILEGRYDSRKSGSEKSFRENCLRLLQEG